MMERTTREMAQYQHLEAFCLMRYKDDEGRDEVLWNSRDGVTPYIVESRYRPGSRARHVDWISDMQAPFHIPSIGDRVFVDITPEHAVRLAAQKVEAWWDHGMSETEPYKNMCRVQAIGHIAAGYPPGTPVLVMVDQLLWQFFVNRAALAGQVRRI